MNARTPRSLHHSEAGGITILVTLMLLVLLTVAAVALSRNALRELIVSGSSRQGTETRELADSGLDYSIYWMIQERENRPAVDPAATSGYQGLIAAMDKLRTQPELGGRYYTINTDGSMTFNPAPGKTGSFNLELLRMGKLPIILTSQIDERLKPDLWAIRSNATLAYGGGMQFNNSREIWVSTSIKQ
jgi:hypothetical protein